MLKKYQPGRPELLINTDWGGSKDAFSPEEAQRKGLLLFHNRWVTKEEQTTQRRKGERNAYVSIRMIGFVLIARAFLVVMNLGSIYKYGIVAAFAAVACAAALAASGAGVMRFAHLAVYPACLILASFFVLPFTSLFEDDKGAPFMITLGLIGLYYLMRRPARQISRLVLRATPPGGAFNRLLASFHTEQELICEEKINGFVGRSDW